MIELSTVLSFQYYTYGEAFTGSDAGKRYRIIKEKREDGEAVFLISVWKEPFSYDNTPKEDIMETDFEFSPAGLQMAVDHINSVSFG